jgi:hypothetical protein
MSSQFVKMLGGVWIFGLLAMASGIESVASSDEVSLKGTEVILHLRNRQENSTQTQPGSQIVAETGEQGELTAVLYGGVGDPVDALERFTLQELNGSSGAVFEPNHNAIVLFGKSVDAQTGGAVDLRHIYNGIFGTYHHCAALLRKDDQGHWAFYSPAGQVISQATLVVYSVGIRTIEGFDCKS